MEVFRRPISSRMDSHAELGEPDAAWIGIVVLLIPRAVQAYGGSDDTGKQFRNQSLSQILLHTGEGKAMKLNKLVAIPAIAFAAGISLAACGSTVVGSPPTTAKSAVTHSVTAVPVAPVATKSATPAAPAVPAKPAQPAPASPLPTVSTNNGVNPGTQAVEPTAIYLSADGNGDLTGITWSSWTTYSAEGAGSINVNNCQPNCAQGTTVNVPVSIALAAPTGSSSPYFTAMTITDSSGNRNIYAAGSNGDMSVISDALYIADEAPPATQPAPAGLTNCGGGCTRGQALAVRSR